MTYKREYRCQKCNSILSAFETARFYTCVDPCENCLKLADAEGHARGFTEGKEEGRQEMIEGSGDVLSNFQDEMSDIMTECYQKPHGFAAAYSADPDKVFIKFASRLKVVPVDLKERLEETYKYYSTFSADDKDSA